jgi:WD40 repeat protein
VALDREGLHLAAGVGSGRVRVWDTRTNDVLIDQADHAARVRSLAFDGGGQRLITGSGDGTVRLLDLEARGGQVFDNDGEWVRAVSLDPAGRYVAAGSGRGGIRIWDRTVENVSVILTGHTGRVLALRFTPSGRHLLSGAADGTLRCWDVGAGRELCRVRVDATLLTCAIDAAGKSFLAATARHLVAVSMMDDSESAARS